jgi:hypothetical protein
MKHEHAYHAFSRSLPAALLHKTMELALARAATASVGMNKYSLCFAALAQSPNHWLQQSHPATFCLTAAADHAH